MEYRTILVGVSDDEPSLWAVEAASLLAERLGSRLVLLHVIDRVFVHPMQASGLAAQELVDLRTQATRLLHRLRDHIIVPVDVQCMIELGNPADQIILAAHQLDAAMIFLGSHGRGRLAHLFLGSTAEAVIRGAPCPVVTIREQQVASHRPAQWAS